MRIEVSEFLECFSPISLDYIQPEEKDDTPWVFSNAFLQSSSSSSCAADPKIHDVIKFVFSNIEILNWGALLGQFWAPVTIGGRQQLTTSGQPFAVWHHLYNEIAKYRLYTEKHKYNIDKNYKLDIEDMIKSGGPATAFMSRLPHLSKLQRIQAEPFDFDRRLNCSVMLPVCFPSQSSSCIGVLEFTFDHEDFILADLVLKTIRALNRAGLDVISVQHLIPLPYKDIHGLKLAKDEIKEALKVVCETHNLALAQVWITYEHKNNHVLLSSSLEDTQTMQLLAVKLTGYLNYVASSDHGVFDTYIRMCDAIPQGIWSGALVVVELPFKTLQDYGSHYISDFSFYSFIYEDDLHFEYSALTICLRSNYTGDFNYAFEFIWIKHSEYVNLLEGIMLTLKRCLPRFKFASGAELGDQLEVLVIKSYVYFKDIKNDKTEKIKIFKGKRSSSPVPKAPEEGKSYIAPSTVMRKTTAKVLPREAIEKQFGKTMNEAAKNLTVSLSTFKRKFKELGIPEWPGPGFVKRKANDLSIIQLDTNENHNGAIQEPSTINIDQHTLTIKAELSDDMIKFHLPVSRATFATIEQEIGVKLNFSVGTYKLKYLDEDGDWILLTSNEEMRDCIKSSTKSYRSVVKIRVQPISGPGVSFGMQSIK